MRHTDEVSPVCPFLLYMILRTSVTPNLLHSFCIFVSGISDEMPEMTPLLCISDLAYYGALEVPSN